MGSGIAQLVEGPTATSQRPESLVPALELTAGLPWRWEYSFGMRKKTTQTEWTENFLGFVLLLPDKAVREVPIANVLRVIDVHHFANGPTLNHLLDLEDRRKVS